MSFPYKSYLEQKYRVEAVHFNACQLQPTVQIFTPHELEPYLQLVRSSLIHTAPVLLTIPSITHDTMNDVFTYAFCLSMAMIKGEHDIISIFDTHAAYVWDALNTELQWAVTLSLCSDQVLTMLGENVKQHNVFSIHLLMKLLLVHPSVSDLSRDIVVSRHTALKRTSALLW
jgi:hypothetical protein